MDSVNPEEVIGVIDMDALLEKLGLIEWTAGVYQGEITFRLPDTVTLQEPYQMTVLLEENEDVDSENE